MKLRTWGRSKVFKFLANSAFVFVSRVSGAGIAFATQILMARWMGAEQLGVYVLAFSWCIQLSNLAGMGFPYAAFRFVGEGLAQQAHSRIRGFVRRGTQIVAISSLLIALAGVLLSALPRSPLPADHVSTFVFAMLCVPVLALMRLHSDIANAFSWFVLTFLPNNTLRPALLLAALFLVWRATGSLSAETAMLVHLGVMLAIAGGQLIVFRQAVRQTLAGAQPQYQTGLWVRTSASLLLITIVTAYSPEIHIIVAGPYLSSQELAVYYACYRIAFLIVFGLQAVDAITLPRMTRLYAQGDKAALQRLIAGATQLKFWAAACAVTLFALFGEYFLLAFGETFTAGHAALMILAGTQLLLAAIGPVDELLIITGHHRRCLPAFTVALILMPALSLLLVPRFLVNGAALTAFIVTALWALWLHALVVRHLGIRPSVFGVTSLVRPVVN